MALSLGPLVKLYLYRIGWVWQNNYSLLKEQRQGHSYRYPQNPLPTNLSHLKTPGKHLRDTTISAHTKQTFKPTELDAARQP